MHKIYFILLLTVSGFLLSEYKNTNGVASEKSFADMLKWIRSDIEPEISKIELSSEWQKLNLLEVNIYNQFMMRIKSFLSLSPPGHGHRTGGARGAIKSIIQKVGYTNY